MGKSIGEQATLLAMRALGKLMEDPKYAAHMAGILVAAQRGRETLGTVQSAALRAGGLATRDDFKAVGRRLSQLKRTGLALLEKLEALEMNQH